MLWRIFVSGVAAFAGFASVSLASPKDDIISGLNKLADSSNYSWRITTVDSLSQGNVKRDPVVGKTEHGGLSCVSMPFLNTNRDAVISGQNVALKTTDGWQTSGELIAELGAGAKQDQSNHDAAIALLLLRMPPNLDSIRATVAAATNVRMVAQREDMKVYDDTLDAAQVKEVLSARMHITPAEAALGLPAGAAKSGVSGEILFWVRDGVLVKTKVHILGSIHYSDEKSDRDINRTIDTEFTQIGSSAIQVPVEAKAKLSL